MKTAVEWLADMLITENEIILKGENFKLIEQAKEMEKKNLYNFYTQGGVDAIMEADRNAEQYYNKTFKSE